MVALSPLAGAEWQFFDNLEYWDHDCDGNATLNADFFVMENDNG